MHQHEAATLWNEHDLLRSLKQLGPLLPVYWWRGHVLDGSRRRRLCHHLRIPIVNLEADDQQAPRLLWVLAPDRALERWQQLPLVERAKKFGVEPSEVARVTTALTRAAQPKLSRRPGFVPHGKWDRLNLRIPGVKLQQLKERAAKRGLSLSDYCRELL